MTKTEKTIAIIAIYYCLYMIVQFVYMIFKCSYFYYYFLFVFKDFNIQAIIVYLINFIIFGGMVYGIRKQGQCINNIL